MVDVSDKVLEGARDYLLQTGRHWTDGVCVGRVVDCDTGKRLYGISEHVYCHSWVLYAFQKYCYGGAAIYGGWPTKYHKNAINFLTLTCYSRTRSKHVCRQEASDALVLWMARESPFSFAVLNKDDTECLTEGGVILLCGPDGLNLAQAMWVCKVLRFISEGGGAADTWYELVKGGVDPMLAVYVATNVRAVKGATFGYTGPHGHSTVFPDGQRADVLGLLSRNFNPAPGDTYSLFISPKGVKYPKDKYPGTVQQTVQGFCKPVLKTDGWGGVIQGNGADGPTLVKSVLEWQADLVKCLPDGIPDIKSMPVVVKKPKLPDESTVYLEIDL